MKLFLIFIAFGVANGNSDDLPSFSWDPDLKSDEGVPLLIVHFPDGGKDDVASLNRYNPFLQQSNENEIDSCIFNGYLRDEPDVYVTMSGGCPFTNSFEIQFRSSRLSGFVYKVTDGKVEMVPSVFRGTNRGPGQESDVRDEAIFSTEMFDGLKYSINAGDRAAFPATGFNLTIKMYYDQNFKTKFGADSTNACIRIINFVQAYYFLSSLTFRMILTVVAVQEIPIILTDKASTASLETVKTYVTDDAINANVFLSFDNNNAGTVGIAWVGSVCGDKTFRTSINEYFVSDAKTAEIVAHEIGHNLNMSHDFLDSGVDNPRFDSHGVSCKNIGGVMDYFQPAVTRWSTCSVEDFTAYYNYVFGILGNYCVSAASSDTPSTTTTTTTTSTTTTISTTTTTTTTTTSTTTTKATSTSTTTKTTTTTNCICQ